MGVNGGSAPPGVPRNTPFIWRDVASGAQLIVMWHAGGYSGNPVDDADDCMKACSCSWLGSILQLLDAKRVRMMYCPCHRRALQ